MIIREATIADIPQMQLVRNSVKENRLSDPSLITDGDYEMYITQNDRGKGWVCETGNKIIGFAFADLFAENIWALFVLPEAEGNGIGKELHDTMLNWYFSNRKSFAWLGTSPGTRAEKFYRAKGWKENGTAGKGEIRFEMTQEEWQQLKRF